MADYLDVREEVAEALAMAKPVVALETTVIAHGLPRPTNLETARRMEAAVREQGAVPATIGILEARVKVGLTPGELEIFANSDEVAKVSCGDMAAILADGGIGATTVAAAAFIAARAGIPVLATGGIGGVHRGGEKSMDISADLGELARSPVAVICSGAKAILDLARTLEVLETLGVPVVGCGTGEFSAFFAKDSGLRLHHRIDTPE
ncbi:MAG TPA: pseudouridine-5'-phosphate glycosidase, partial [Terriglobales bacterium]|nr:pseudouridine-5'-phosphate glycosidase [Terriglobales bacterium]